MSRYAGGGDSRGQPELILSSSTVFDFFSIIHAILKTIEGSTFDLREGWLLAARLAIGPEALRELRYYFGQNPSAIDLPVLVMRSDRADRVEGFLQYLESTPPAELAKVVLAGRMPEGFHPLLDDLLERYEGVREDDPKLQYVLRWFLRAEEREKAKVFLRFPAESKRRLLELLEDVYVRLYRAEEARLAPIFAADIERRLTTAVTSDPVEIVERFTGERIEGDQRLRRVVLAPSLHIRPFTLSIDYGGTRIIIYPLPKGAEEVEGGASGQKVEAAGPKPEAVGSKPEAVGPRPGRPEAVEPAPRRGRPGRPSRVGRKRGRPRAGAREAASLVAVHKALGDETRLRILRLLAERERYTQELAEALELTHPTVLHHLDLMLRAGLVSVHDTERLRYYRLNGAALEALSARILEYLRS